MAFYRPSKALILSFRFGIISTIINIGRLQIFILVGRVMRL